jgi:hypothetical protein
MVRSTGEAPSFFKAALRAAVKEDAPHAESARPVPTDNAPTGRSLIAEESDAPSVESSSQPLEANSDQPQDVATARESAESFRLRLSQQLPEGAPTEPAASDAAPALRVLSGTQAAAKEGPAFLELLAHLRPSAADAPPCPAGAIARMTEPAERCRPSSAGCLPPEISEAFDDLQPTRPTDVEGALEPARAEEGPATDSAPGSAKGRQAGVAGGSAAPMDATAGQGRAAAEFAAVLRRPPGPVRQDDSALRSVATAVAPEAERSVPAGAGAAPGSLVLMPDATMAASTSAAPRANHSPQPASEATAQPPLHLADVMSARLGGQAMDGRSGPSADSGDGEPFAQDLLSAKLPANSVPVSGEGEGFSEGMALIHRFARPSPSVEGALDRAADGPTGFQNKETATGPLRSEVFDQIVQRAAVQLRSDQGEMHIDLKPDFLGRVRMQILTENQQVSVRIFADRPAVRDLIETGLYQLKSDLPTLRPGGRPPMGLARTTRGRPKNAARRFNRRRAGAAAQTSTCLFNLHRPMGITCLRCGEFDESDGTHANERTFRTHGHRNRVGGRRRLQGHG